MSCHAGFKRRAVAKTAGEEKRTSLLDLHDAPEHDRTAINHQDLLCRPLLHDLTSSVVLCTRRLPIKLGVNGFNFLLNLVTLNLFTAAI